MSNARIIRLAPKRMNPSFSAVRIDPKVASASIDPFLAVDRFSMSGPTFPPHPHAGFSAVTYVLPESIGSIANRDSRGDASLIRPGGIHWTSAGSGMLHEEIPAVTGQTVEGLQIFVNHPFEAKLSPPAIYHIEPANIPLISLEDGGWVRVVAGSIGDTAAPFTPTTQVTILDVRLAAFSRFEWAGTQQPAHVALVHAGELRAAGGSANQNGLVLPADGEFSASAGPQGSRFTLFAGRPLGEAVIWRGPFAMANEDQAADAVRRYLSGEMGRLEPSPEFT